MSLFTRTAQGPDNKSILLYVIPILEADQVFSLFDTNKDGYLDKAEIRAILVLLGERPTHADVLRAIDECDFDKNGKIDLKEFRTWYKKISSIYHGEKLNRLLIKDSFGRTKKSSYKLPKQTFVYGKPSGFDPEDARDLTSSWAVFVKGKNPRAGIPDYVQMNINAQDEKCVKSSEFRAHHLCHTVNKKIPTTRSVILDHRPTMPEEYRNNRFGFKTLSSEPASALIKSQWAHCPGDESDYPTSRQRPRSAIYPHQTRSSCLLSETNKSLLNERNTKKSEWKMNKFSNVKSSLVTRWTPEEKKAMTAFLSKEI